MIWELAEDRIFDIATLLGQLESESASIGNTVQKKRMDVKFGFHY
jgi:hypothetical protein